MGKIVFTLNKSLQYLNITPYKIAVESRVRPNTIYGMVEGTTTRINTETLIHIIDALNLIAKEQGVKKGFDTTDVFIYKK